MKKAFQSMLIIFLAYTFLSCPVLARVSFADDEGIRALPPWQEKIQRLTHVLSFIKVNLPDWIQDYDFPRTSADVEANKEKRKKIKEDIRDIWNSPIIE